MHGAATPSDAQKGITNTLKFCWENTNQNSNNPWKFSNGANTFITCNSIDLGIKGILEIPEALKFTNQNLSYTALPDTNVTTITLPTPQIIGSNKVYEITGISRSGCLTASVTLDEGNTNVCDSTATPPRLFGEVDAKIKVYSTCASGGNCIPSFCIAEVTNHLLYHCPGSCTGTKTSVHPITTAHPIKFQRIDNPNDNIGILDLQRAYSCDTIQLEVRGSKSPGTPDSIFLQLTWESVAGNDTIFSLFTTAADNQYSTNGGTTWVNFPSADLKRPKLINGKWVMQAYIKPTASPIGNLNFTDLRFRLKFRVKSTLLGGIYQLQDIRADIGYNVGSQYFGACDTWAESMLILSHDYSTQSAFV